MSWMFHFSSFNQRNKDWNVSYVMGRHLLQVGQAARGSSIAVRGAAIRLQHYISYACVTSTGKTSDAAWWDRVQFSFKSDFAFTYPAT